MKILNALWVNAGSAMLVALIFAGIRLLVWGEHIGQQFNAWILFWFVVFNIGDAIKWTWEKYRGNV